jgi:hypothetical protein
MIWDSLRYGFAPTYWITVAGIPVVFVERGTGLSLPTGFAIEDASLVIDKSSDVGLEQIDRERGVGVGLPLSFKLLDTATVRDWLRRWSDQATLTTALSATGAVATVDSTSGWPGTGEIHLGIERCTYTGTTATTFTGLSRGQSGSLPYRHTPGTTGQIVTDRPRFWRGRIVTLWASPTDPSGLVTGTTLADDAVQVWAGRITGGPERETDGFRFEAQSLDRILEEPLVGEVTGKVVEIGGKYAVSQGWTAEVCLIAYDGVAAQIWAYTVIVQPFLADADGDLLSAQEIRDRISDAWTDGVSAAGAGADLSDLVWSKKKGWDEARVQVVQDANIVSIHQWLYIDGKDQPIVPNWMNPGGMPAGNDILVSIGWISNGNPAIPYDVDQSPPGSLLLTVQLDSGDPGDVPPFNGKIRIGVGQTSYLAKYGAAEVTGGGQLYFTGIEAVGDTKSLPQPAACIGADVTVLFTDEGAFLDALERTLMSSGTGERSATYDTLARGQGYGVDESLIEQGSFDSASAPLSSLQVFADVAGKTFADVFGGALGLFRRAVVARPDKSQATRPIQFTLVSTAPFGAGWSLTIGDDDLLSDDGDPVVSVRRADSPNAIIVTREVGDVSDRLAYFDHASIEATGRREATYPIPAKDRAALGVVALSAAAVHFAADQTVQAIELRVPPWIDADAGDLVQLDLTHPALWTWNASPATFGYTGPGRVVGRRINLRTCQVTLTILVDGGVKVRALSPSAQVKGRQHVTTPTWIDVPLKYLDHFTNALADAGGNIFVYHYWPGQTETVGNRHEVSAAAESGGLCRLTIASNPTGHNVIVDDSYLTLPTLTGGHVSTWQEAFAHVDDGTQWG